VVIPAYFSKKRPYILRKKYGRFLRHFAVFVYR